MTRAYFNRIAEVWDGTVAERDANRLSKVARSLNLAAGSVVLDVGTGTGVFMPFLLNEVGKSGQIIALDFAERMLRIARDKKFGENVNYLCADVTGLPLKNEFIDATVCYSSFPHFHDKVAALREINRILKPGGKLFICHTSSRNMINAIHTRVPALAKDILPEEKEMKMLLADGGFAGIKIEDTGEGYFCRALKPTPASRSPVQAQG